MSQKKIRDRPAATPEAPVPALPTLQRNALCKVFERSVFTPQEVAALGYRRLCKAEGIGIKGLETIRAWLRECGCELEPPTEATGPARRRAKKSRANLEYALRILRASGYVVHRAQGNLGGDPEF